jgi:sn-glycerol 3-phosphate transport system ATP-binding protein
MATLELSSVRKTYGGKVEAVKGISFEVPDGQMCVLVGPSGCGKSTLLRMIAGLETITSGSVSIDGKNVNALGPAERDIAMVFQNYALYPHMKVYDNMAYGLRNRGMVGGEIDRLVKEAAATLGLADLLERKPRELSGGQRQRVAMGRAIVRNPKVFLFDEPLSNLDAKLRGQMRIEIKALQNRMGVTSVYVTHDQLEAMTLADLLVVMNGGVIEQIGEPLDIYEKPASIFVAGFIGAPPMNLLPVQAVIVATQGANAKAASAFHIPAGAVTMGFRPEDAKVNLADRAASLPLVLLVEGVEPVGAESYLYGRAASGNVIVRVSGRTKVLRDETLKIAIAFDKLHWFDQSGKRIG